MFYSVLCSVDCSFGGLATDLNYLLYVTLRVFRVSRPPLSVTHPDPDSPCLLTFLRSRCLLPSLPPSLPRPADSSLACSTSFPLSLICWHRRQISGEYFPRQTTVASLCSSVWMRLYELHPNGQAMETWTLNALLQGDSDAALSRYGIGWVYAHGGTTVVGFALSFVVYPVSLWSVAFLCPTTLLAAAPSPPPAFPRSNPPGT